MNIDIETGNQAVDDFFKGNVNLINNFLMALARNRSKLPLSNQKKRSMTFTLVSVKACEKQKIREPILDSLKALP